jgi:ribonuclease BN (tRNA processing enzyme)
VSKSRKLIKMKLTFLGTGGGRFVMITQKRATGGFILELDGEMIHVDPGPGAIVRAVQNRINLRKLTGLVVTHTHPDHSTDAAVVVEAMTAGAKEKRGVLVSNVYAFKPGKSGGYVPLFSVYHLRSLEKHYSLRPGESAKIGSVKVTATKTRHRDSEAIGVVFEGSEKVGYTSDTEYFEGLGNYFRGCDYLIVNCLRAGDDSWPEHMNVNMAEKLINEVRPKAAILTHFGMRMLKVAESEARRIEKNTDVKTIAARDNMVLEFGKSS